MDSAPRLQEPPRLPTMEGNLESGNFTVVDNEGLALFVVLNIDAHHMCSTQAASVACAPASQSVPSNKCTTAKYSPVTPEKTVDGGARNNGKGKRQKKQLKAIQEDVIAYESDEEVTKSAEYLPTKKNHKPIQEKAKQKKHRPKVIINGKPRTPKTPATSGQSIKSSRKNVKKKGLNESTPIEANRKLPKRSCKRAFVFDAVGELEDDGAELGSEAITVVGQGKGKDVIVLTEQDCAITEIFEHLPLHSKRKRTSKITECSSASPILTREDQAESSTEKQPDGPMDIYDLDVAHGNIPVHTAEDGPNQILDEQHFNNNRKESNNSYPEHNALAHHSEEGTMVPYEGPFDPTKKLLPRAKVHIDEETNRVWKLLLADINSPGIDGVDEENIKHWDKEREVYRGLADLFIARMRLVQGDRHFSPWKGSVVDSVVGVFLTQNVSDILSSSAFLKLASHFPPKSKINKSSCSEKQTVKISTILPGPQSHPPFPCPTGDGTEICSGRCKPSNSKKATESNSNENSDDIPDTRSKRNAKKKEVEIDWDILRREVQANGHKRERPEHTMDSVDWEAIRFADVAEISNVIRDRGMNNRLAERIQDFLNRIARDHESVDLEWLRDIAPDKAKEYLLSIFGIGLKSVECVRLLTLHHLAFPVDTNVARVAVRLGWVPIKPLPESVQLHLLELYPMLNTIQKYLWPRLCKLDQETLYELHYQMITFGKVFCTKVKPNCNACPMRGDCKHYASAFASSKLALPGPENLGTMNESENGATYQNNGVNIGPMALTLPPAPVQSNESSQLDKVFGLSTIEPIIEEPETPEAEYKQISVTDIEDVICEEPDDDIPEIIKLNIEEFMKTLQNYAEHQDSDMSKALVALTSEATSIPMPKLRNVGRLRTQHQVYELPDAHPLLIGLDKRESDDPGHYLLAIWTPGETAELYQPSENRCNAHGPDKLCDDHICFSCNNIRGENSHTVRGTLLIPCRTATMGSFPLNGTYFQVNEVFADHESSINPIHVPRDSIWNLPRRTVYFGTSVTSIFRGFTTQEIQQCFWRGYVCVRAFDRETRAPRPLISRLHSPASKSLKPKVKKNDRESSPEITAKSKAQKNGKEITSQKCNADSNSHGNGKNDGNFESKDEI